PDDGGEGTGRSIEAAQRARARLESGCDLVDQLARPVEGQPLGAELTPQAADLPRRLLHPLRGLARRDRGGLFTERIGPRRPRDEIIAERVPAHLPSRPLTTRAGRRSFTGR